MVDEGFIRMLAAILNTDVVGHRSIEIVFKSLLNKADKKI